VLGGGEHPVADRASIALSCAAFRSGFLCSFGGQLLTVFAYHILSLAEFGAFD